MAKVNLKNARNSEQIRRMKKLKEAGKCYFCREGDIKEGTVPLVLQDGGWWYIMKNDFPLDGSVHHYMIVPKRHITKMSEITEEREAAAMELFVWIGWLEKALQVEGYSVAFARSGNTMFTGATLDHLHVHFLVGGPRPEKEKLDLAEDVVPVILAFKKK